ncbi:hypothetical protein JW899_04410 [Candidatus Uhrbacteria bacterium]|nr:hypothetical protein [Candidatus Uhrbacteria bacterium]
MIETSKDLLFVVLALCVLWLTVFLSWLLYYVIAIVRDVDRVIRLIKVVATKIDGLASSLNEKLDRSAASFSLVAKAMKEVVTWAIEQKTSSAARKRTATAKKAGK